MPQNAIVIAAAASVGWILGGWIAMFAYWLPLRRADAARFGFCPACGSKLDVIRVAFGAGRGSGRCSSCGSTVREPWPVAEVGAAAVFALLALRFGPSSALVLYCLYATVLIAITLIDWRHRIIPDLLVAPTAIVAAIASLFTVGIVRGLLGALVSFAIFLVFYLLALLIYRREGVLGLGDVKLSFLVGFMVGLPASIAASLYGIFAGGVLAIGWLLAGKTRRDAMPYGPALVLGAVAAVLIDPSIWR